jgi:hypothetical protein
MGYVLLPVVGGWLLNAQDRARDAPFSCEPVVPGSVVFRGFALERYTPAENEPRPVRFKVEEAFFGIGPKVTEYEVPLDSEEPIAAGEERIVSSSPDETGPHWTADSFDEEQDKAYLVNLRKLRSGQGRSRLVGWTSGPDGSPLPHVAVQATGGNASFATRSDERGTFEFGDIPPGKYRVSAARAQYEAFVPFQDVEVLPAACGVVSLPFTFRGVVRGTIRDRRGNPLQGIHVDIESFVDDEWSMYDTAVTDAEGNYSLRDVAAGRYRAGVNLRGRYDPYPVLYAPGVEDQKDGRTFTISENEAIGLADFWMPEPKLRRFEIQVFWPDGQPASGASIGLVFGRWDDTTDVHTDARGVAAVQGYAMLGYRLFAYGKRSAADQEFASSAVVIGEGDQNVSFPFF